MSTGIQSFAYMVGMSNNMDQPYHTLKISQQLLSTQVVYHTAASAI